MNGVNQLPTESYQGDFIAQPGAEGVANAAGAYNNAAQLAGQMSGFGQQALTNSQQMPTFTTSVPTSTYNMGDRQQNLDQVIQAATNPVLRQLQEQILPQLRSSALESGAYSSDRAMGVVPGQAIDAATRNMQDIATQLGYEDYNNWENRRLQAYETDQNAALQGFNLDTQRGLGLGGLQSDRLAQLPGLMEAVTGQAASAGDLYGRATDIQTTAEQAAIDNALQREAYGFSRPFMGLDTAAGLMQTLGQGYGTQTGSGSSTTVEKTGGLGNILQGVAGLGMAGLGLATGGGPLAGLFGGAAKAAGAGAGAIAPMASNMIGFNPWSNGLNPRYSYGTGG